MSKTNKRTNYQIGVEAEREIVKLFKSAGYSVARIAGSHGPFDIVALKTARKRNTKLFICVLVQSKRWDKTKGIKFDEDN